MEGRHYFNLLPHVQETPLSHSGFGEGPMVVYSGTLVKAESDKFHKRGQNQLH